MDMATMVASWSKDPSTQIGAVIVSPERRILATGYNGFPRGIEDDNRLHIRDQKYQLIVHAEMNAILNAAKHGVQLKGSILFVKGLMVCADCAKHVVQTGIAEINVEGDIYNPRWAAMTERSLALFDEADIPVYLKTGNQWNVT